MPLLDAGRARRELGWTPSIDARAALAQVVTGMADGASTLSPALRPRTVAAELTAVVRRGRIATRLLP